MRSKGNTQTKVVDLSLGAPDGGAGSIAIVINVYAHESSVAHSLIN